jgi:voltage-gated potassium channel
MPVKRPSSSIRKRFPVWTSSATCSNTRPCSAPACAAASAVVLVLGNDSEGVFATAVVRDHAPEVPLIVRANRVQNIPRLYQAGADFALSVGQVAGQILAYHLRGEQAIAVEQRLKFIRVAAGKLAGGHPWRDQVRERTGAAVVAVERGNRVIVEFDGRFRRSARRHTIRLRNVR